LNLDKPILISACDNGVYYDKKEDNQYVLDTFIKPLINNNIKIIKVDDNIEDWEQLIIMSLCDHNIIANSSFSWWGWLF
jgi:hypothetical protein